MKKIFDIIKEEIENISNIDLSVLYHGSKYFFKKFDINQVNTGQHSQDFGYGLYFTSDKQTAEFYANELSNFKTPLEKYNDIIKNNTYNEILYDYIKNNNIVSAKRVLNELINNKIGYVDEWKKLLYALNSVERYGYLYTVKITNPNYIDRGNYLILKDKLNISDKEMNKILINKGYNGIKYRINSFGTNKTRSFENEFNVVIIDDNVITITNIEKLNFNGVLKI